MLQSSLFLAITVFTCIQATSSSSRVVVVDSNNEWHSLVDPVMGGVSTGKVGIENDTIVLKGEVKIVPKLNGPGFISAVTRAGDYPDMRSCDGLTLNIKSNTKYSGFHVSFGMNYAGSNPFIHGYKAAFNAPPVGQFGDVFVPFTEFSDNWEPTTGDQIVTCEDDKQFCPDDKTLYNIERFEIMAEGEVGDVDLEIKSVTATGCDDNVQITHSDPRPIPNYSDSDKSKKDTLANGDIRIETFSDPSHRWFSFSDRVMGGISDSSVTIDEEKGVISFQGTVLDVEKLGAPGFVSMETRGDYFPDVSMCKALKINLKSANDYSGLHINFGTHHLQDAPQYVRGYKARVTTSLPVDEFNDIVLPFSDFSDNWDPKTGDIIETCKDNSERCPDMKTLIDFGVFGIMGEGVGGRVDLEIKYIHATDCSKEMDNTSPLNSTYYESETSGKAFSWIGIIFGFVIIALVSFMLGRRQAMKRKGFVEAPEVQNSVKETELNSVVANSIV